MYTASMLYLENKFEGTSYTCGKLRSRPPSLSENIVTELHQIVTSGHMQIKRGTAHVLDIKLLRSVLRTVTYRYQCLQMLQPGDQQLSIDISNKFLLRYDADNDWLLCILQTGERHFNLNGNVITKN